MATPPAKAIPASDDLKPEEVTDERDTTPRLATAKGKRLRAIPSTQHNETTIIIKKKDFADHEIKHPDVTFDFRRDGFTVPVGKKLSPEAADFLAEEFPMQFEYVNEGS